MKRAAVFFDRDNTLIASDGYLGDPKQVVLVEGAADAIAKARSYGFVAVTFSNQSGVARGMFSETDVDSVNRRMDELLLAQNGRAVISRHEYCPYHPEASVEKYREDSPLRKPKPGMILAAAEKLNLDLHRSWVIGDAPRDIEAGKAAGCKTILFKHPTLAQSPAAMEESAVEPDYTVTSLKEAIEVIGREMYKRPGIAMPQEKGKEVAQSAPVAAPVTVAVAAPAAVPELEPAPIEAPLPAPVAAALGTEVTAQSSAPARGASSVMSYSTLDSEDAGLLLPPDDQDMGLTGFMGGFAPLQSSTSHASGNGAATSSATAVMEAPAVEPRVIQEPEPIGAPIAATPEPEPVRVPTPAPAPVTPRVERPAPTTQSVPRPAPVIEAPKPEPAPTPTPRTEARPEPKVEAETERRRVPREEVVTQAPAPITLSTAKLESLSEQILSELRRRREDPSDFSVSKLMAGIVQVLVLAILFLSYLQRENPAVLQNWLLFAIALQTLTIALLIMGRQK